MISPRILWVLLLTLLPLYVQGQVPDYASMRELRDPMPALVGIGPLASMYFGDLRGQLGSDAARGHHTGMGFQLFAEQRLPVFNNRLAGRLSLGYLPISADDFQAQESYLRRRNLHFRNRLWDLTAMGVFYLRNPADYPIKRTLRTAPRLLPYVMLGLGAVYSNPQAMDSFGGTWVDLQPLRTEGKSYSKIHLVIPMGAGLSYRFTPQWSLAFDAVLRLTSTDYLDDVSGTYPDRNQVSDHTYPFTFRSNEFVAAWNGKPRTDFWPGTEQDQGYQRQVAGEQRGNPKVKDYYLGFNFSVRYRLGVGRYVQ